MTTGDSTAIEAAALGRLHNYLRRALPVAEHDEMIARDAFVSGFKSGGRWSLQSCAALADPAFRTALGVVAEFVRYQEPTSLEPIPRNASECRAFVTNVLLGLHALPKPIDILPAIDGELLLQWPEDGPVFRLSVHPSHERARVIERRAGVPVITREAVG